MRTKMFLMAACAAVSAVGFAQQVYGPGGDLTIQQFRGDYGDPGFGYTVSDTDLIAGMIATNTSPLGWHGATPLGNDYREGALTDGDKWLSIANGNLAGLLNDFRNPAQTFRYTFAGPTEIGSISVLTGNGGRDGRIFHTYAVYSLDASANRTLIAYVESAQLGSLNNANDNTNQEIATTISRAGGLLATATAIEFDFYPVDNTGGQYRDPYDGVNPFTNIDDGLTAAFVAPIIREIDVQPVPEPATIAALGLGALALIRRRRTSK